jgi:iron complex outermembrane receptor protein
MFAFNINGNHDFILPSVPFDGFVRADYAWKDKVQWDETNSPNAVEGAYGQLGAALGIRSKGEHRYTVTAFGKNLTNKFHTAGIAPGPTPESVLLPDYKRIWGVRFEYKY